MTNGSTHRIDTQNKDMTHVLSKVHVSSNAHGNAQGGLPPKS